MLKRQQKLLVVMINRLASVLPAMSAAISYYAWTKTYRHQRPKRELACYAAADRKAITFAQQKILTYRWGQGPKVLLLHGWNGRATQMFQVVEQLVASGYQVLAIDQPGCGDSEGRHSGLMSIRELIKHLAETEGRFAAIVAHSFGWLAAINAKPDNITDCLIGIAPPSDFHWLLQGFGDYYQLNKPAIRALKVKICQHYNIDDLAEISIAQVGSALRLPGVVIHDETDDKIPVDQIAQIRQAWNNCEIYRTNGLGHTRILYDKNVSQIIVNHIKKYTHANH